jgi:TRAP-type transport system periplasmic protein
MRRTLIAVVVMVLLFGVASSSNAADVIKLKFANYFPPTHMNSVMMAKFCEELNKKLQGKVELTQYEIGRAHV